MAVGTDGARSTQVDPANQTESWDSMLSGAIADIGINPNDPIPADDPAADAPQRSASGTSDGAGDGSPDAPAAKATGDDGSAPPVATASDDAPAPPDTDPLANATPFTFTVGDETRSIEARFASPAKGWSSRKIAFSTSS
jgi:hypothetical protein